MNYFLGVDTGATKSVAMVADSNGRLLGAAQAGAGNWEAVGWDEAKRVIHTISREAAAQAGIALTDINGAGFGLAGYDWPEDYQPHVDIIKEILPHAPFELVNDAFIGLWAGAEASWGVVVSAGTSCNCYGRDQAGNIGRVTGSSYWFGEYAGASEIVRQAIKAVARAWSLRAPETMLGEVFCQETGAKDVEDLMAGLMRRRYQIRASFAPLVFETAEQGDTVALEIIRWAGEGLGDLALGVIRQLQIQDKSFDVVLTGSTFSGSPLLQERMQKIIHQEAPLARLVRLEIPPVTGAVLLGMEQGGALTAVAKQTLISQVETTYK